MRRERPSSADEMVTRYSASEMPTAVIKTLQRDNSDALARYEIDAHNAFRVCNLLLTIALLKLQEVAP